MMSPTASLLAVGIMALVTYLIRALPLALFQKQIKNRFVQSFLYYVPYAVLAAMVLPDIFYCADGPLPAIAGLITALILSWFGKPLLVVALSASGSVFLMELLLKWMG